MKRYHVTIGAAHLRITCNGAPLKLSNRETTYAYSSIIDAADEAVRALQLAFNAQIDWTLVHSELSLEGSRDDLDIVFLHWHVRWGAALRDLKLIQASPHVGSSSGGGGSAWLPNPKTVAARRLIEKWTSLSEELEAVGLGVESEWEDVLIALRERKPRIGIVGVTGAGKSMLINGLLGRRVLSSSAGNSTACIVELTYSEEEYLSVTPRPTESIQREIDARQESPDIASQTRCINGLRRALSLAPERKYQLFELENFTNIERGDGTVLGIERITVHLHCELLTHGTIVDTPGTHDPNEERRALTRREASLFDAWIYVVRSDQSPTESVTGDWRYFDGEVSNPHGGLVLTRVDALGQDGGNPRDELEQRLADYRSLSWKRDTRWCAALAAVADSHDAWALSTSKCIRVRESLNLDPRTMRSIQRRLEDLDSSSGEVNVSVIRRYGAEVSGIRSVESLIASVGLGGQLHVASSSLLRLSGCAAAASARLQDQANRLGAAREARRDRYHLRMDRSDIERTFRDDEKRFDEAEARIRLVEQRSPDVISQAISDFRKRAESLTPSTEYIKNKTSAPFFLFGQITFDSDLHFAVPLAAVGKQILVSESIRRAAEIMDALDGLPDTTALRAELLAHDWGSVFSSERDDGLGSVVETERVFEWSSSAHERLRLHALAACSRICRTFESQLIACLDRRLLEIHGCALRWLESQRVVNEQSKRIRLHILQLEIDRLGDVAGSHGLLAIERRIEAVAALQKKVEKLLEEIATIVTN